MGKLKKLHDHVTKNIVTMFILNSRRPTVQMRPNLYRNVSIIGGINKVEEVEVAHGKPVPTWGPSGLVC